MAGKLCESVFLSVIEYVLLVSKSEFVLLNIGKNGNDRRI